MERNKIIAELTAGICELTWVDSFTMEHKVSVTLSTNHLNEEIPNPFDDDKHLVTMWDLVDESWCSIPVSVIIDVERLTGKGVKGEDDRIASLEGIFDGV